MDTKYKARREEIEAFFESNTKPNSSSDHLSPTRSYSLTIDQYKSFSRGIIKRLSDGKIIADIKRNFSHFWFSWCQHANGCEYLLCGEDYQGQTVVNLTEEKVSNYFPDSGYEGTGFCWVDTFPSPDSKILAVDGCYWAHPYDIVFFDFSEPDKLPYKELHRVTFLEACNGWVTERVFEFTRELEFRKSDKAPYDSLSDKEQEILDKDTSLIGYMIETVEVNALELLEKVSNESTTNKNSN